MKTRPAAPHESTPMQTVLGSPRVPVVEVREGEHPPQKYSRYPRHAECDFGWQWLCEMPASRTEPTR